MANAKCRTCDRAADAGAYCSSCAAAIMAKALNPFFGGRRKKLSRPEAPSPPLNNACSGSSKGLALQAVTTGRRWSPAGPVAARFRPGGSGSATFALASAACGTIALGHTGTLGRNRGKATTTGPSQDRGLRRQCSNLPLPAALPEPAARQGDVLVVTTVDRIGWRYLETMWAFPRPVAPQHPPPLPGQRGRTAL